MGLQEYRKKRDFKRTREPRGGRVAKTKQKPLRYVIQKHAASRLHYDFRLELDGILKSWAVPKGPSLNPADKRLAVEVEDHPLEYGSFEGTIPKGEYGGGTVMLWDEGTWTPDDDVDAAKALRAGKLSFTLDGKKLHGSWALMRMAKKSDDDKNNWLLVKHADKFARKKNGAAILEENPTSVATGRLLEEIATDADARSNNGVTKKSAKKVNRTRLKHTAKKAASKIDFAGKAASLAGAKQVRKRPDFSHELCKLAATPPKGEDWLHEIKFDGYRFLAIRDGDDIMLQTRAGKNWAAKFKPLVDALRALPVKKFAIDGEATILLKSGKTSFQQLQNAIKKKDFARLAFYAFDLLYVEGWDIRGAPLTERKKLLKEIIGDENALLRYSDHVVGSGPEVFQNACNLGLEGIISKKTDSTYEGRRSQQWRKIKCIGRDEFVVLGFTAPGGSRKHFGALLLGAYDQHGALRYTGRVGTGFNEKTLASLGKALKAAKRKTPPTESKLSSAEKRGVTWVDPQWVVEVEYTEWTDDGRLRHPAFVGLREDRKPETVLLPSAQQDAHHDNGTAPQESQRKSTVASKNGTTMKPAAKVKQTATGSDAPLEILGVRISSPERVVYPDAEITKGEIAKYYGEIAEDILPFLLDRPLSVVRCPQGRSKQCFFQKHGNESFGDAVKTVRVKEKDGVADYISIDSAEGLLILVQFGVLEFHPWGAKNDDLERPDILTFDLDPGDEVSFMEVKKAAKDVQNFLAHLDLTSFVKTSGGKGLHVVVPLTRKADWTMAKAFAEGVARQMSVAEPKRFLASARKADRVGRIFIDYLRNGRGATSVAPYSTRAKPGAPVSMPLRWEELDAVESAFQYTVHNAPSRLSQLKQRDAWQGFWKTRQQITATRLKIVQGKRP